MTNKKILVAYYSKTGNTERLAHDIAARLGADTEKIIDKKKRTGIFGYMFGGRDAMKRRLTEIESIQKNPADYDIVIMGTPIWGWNATPAITTYISLTKDKLKTIAFFMTSGNTEPQKIVQYLEEISGQKALANAMFNEKELKNIDVYNRKIDDFIKVMNPHTTG